MISVMDFKGNVYEALKPIQDAGGGELLLPARPRTGYVIDKPLDLRGCGAVNVRGEGLGSILYLRGDGEIACDGTVTQFAGLRIYGDPKAPPQCGVVFARNNKAASVNGCGMRGCMVNGSFRGAAVVDLGAELFSLDHVQIATIRGHAFCCGTKDIFGAGRTLDTAKHTCSGIGLVNVMLAVHAPADTEYFPLLLAGGADNVVSSGFLWLSGSNIPAFVAAFSYPRTDGRMHVPRRICLPWVETEASKKPAFGILYRSHGGQVMPEAIETRREQWRACAEMAGYEQKD